MLEIWGRTTSSNVQALLWCVEEIGVTYTRHDVGHRFGGLDTPEFLAMNPNGTIPVLRDQGGPPIWETGAILRYLAMQYATDLLWPFDPIACAQIDRWAEWAKLNVAMNFTGPVFGRVVRTAAAQRDPVAIQAALATLTHFLRIANNQLRETRFLGEDEFTLADIQMGHVLYRYYDIDIPRPDLPALRRYYKDLTQRPAYRRTVMIPYDDLRDDPDLRPD